MSTFKGDERGALTASVELNTHLTGNLYAIVPPAGRFPSAYVSNVIKRLDAVGKTGWTLMTVVTPQPLLLDLGMPSVASEYRFLIRETVGRFLILGTSGELVTKFIELMNQKRALRTPNVRIPELVALVAKSPSEYGLSAVYAKVNGYGRSFRTVALFGDDLTEALLVREMLPRLVPYRAHLREVRQRLDVLNISERGEIGFLYRGLRSLVSVDRCLKYLSTNALLNWESNLPEDEEQS